MKFIRRRHHGPSSITPTSKTTKTNKTIQGKHASHLIRTTIMGTIGVLAAFTLRDFMQTIFERVADNRKSLLAQFFYTIIILGLIVWLTVVWQD